MILDMKDIEIGDYYYEREGNKEYINIRTSEGHSTLLFHSNHLRWNLLYSQNAECLGASVRRRCNILESTWLELCCRENKYIPFKFKEIKEEIIRKLNEKSIKNTTTSELTLH